MKDPRLLGAALALCAATLVASLHASEYPEEVTNVVESIRGLLWDKERWEAMLGKLTPEMYDELFDAAQKLRASQRAGLIQFIIVHYPGHDEQRREGIATRHVIRYLVKHLSDSGPPARDQASSELYLGAPDFSQRDFTDEILTAIREHPETKYAPRLVGKLGCAAARDLLKLPEVMEKMTPQEPVPEGDDRNIVYEARRIRRLNLMKILDVEAALARLGDRDLERKFIGGFRNRTKEDWWMWLQYLGYIGSPGCVVELARGFLEEPYQPDTGWSPLWLEYPKALHEALPYEPTFWFVHFGESRTDYDNIRAWVKDYLGIEPPERKAPARDPQ